MSRSEDTLHILLRDGTQAGPREVDTLVDRLGPHLAQAALGVRPPRRRLVLPVGASVVALAAGALLMVQPTPPPEAVSLVATWDGDVSGVVSSPVEGLALTIDGRGQLGGSSRHPEVRWSKGRIGISVEPGALDGFTVETQEARVDVTGTAFEVSRDAYGTRVTVSRGSVDVRCGQDQDTVQAMTADLEPIVCLPTTAGGLLGRAQAQFDAKAPAQDIADTLTQARRQQPSDMLTVEILATLALTWQRAGETERAWTLTHEALSKASGFRHDDLRRLALDLALDREDCAGAAVFIDSVGTADARSQRAVAECPELAPRP